MWFRCIHFHKNSVLSKMGGKFSLQLFPQAIKFN